MAVAADISPGTLKAWLNREPRVVPLGAYDQPGRGQGTPRLLTLRRVYAIAMTSELVSLGFAASRAGVLAFTFTDLSVDAGERLVEARKPTFLVANPEHEVFAWFNSRKVTFDDVIGKATPTLPMVSWAVINCGAVMARVQARLKERGVT